MGRLQLLQVPSSCRRCEEVWRLLPQAQRYHYSTALAIATSAQPEAANSPSRAQVRIHAPAQGECGRERERDADTGGGGGGEETDTGEHPTSIQSGVHMRVWHVCTWQCCVCTLMDL